MQFFEIVVSMSPRITSAQIFPEIVVMNQISLADMSPSPRGLSRRISGLYLFLDDLLSSPNNSFVLTSKKLSYHDRCQNCAHL